MHGKQRDQKVLEAATMCTYQRCHGNLKKFKLQDDIP